jgi:basic membrane protein A
MSKKLYSLLVVLVLSAMILAACAPAAATEAPVPTTAPTEAPVLTTAPTEAPALTTAPTEAPAQTEAPTEAVVSTTAPTEAATAAATQPPAANIKVCEVTDTGGIDDKSFNATAWKGVQDAIDNLGIEGKYLESQQQTDYETNINAFLEEGCDLIITVGFLLGDATLAAAQANPDQKFAIVDYAYDQDVPNTAQLVFSTDQAAFLAGYVAAGTTQTGTVGTFGGLNIPTVTIFMDGFSYGVKYYNDQNSANVNVLGWNTDTQDGLFTGNFESTEDGRTMGINLMDEGADIIMPVAGPVGLGTAAAIQERGNAWIIGVDTDWTVSASEYTPIVLTSVMKNMDVAVYTQIQDVINGTFKGGIVTGTLENNGVDIAPFHDNESAVPDAVKSALPDLKQGIISGDIQTSPSQ